MKRRISHIPKEEKTIDEIVTEKTLLALGKTELDMNNPWDRDEYSAQMQILTIEKAAKIYQAQGGKPTKAPVQDPLKIVGYGPGMISPDDHTEDAILAAMHKAFPSKPKPRVAPKKFPK